MDFLLQLVLLALSIYSWIIIAGVILSLLVGFRVINGYRPEVRSIQRTLDGLIEPVLSPIRRRLPPFGGLDLSPVVALLGINVIQILIEKIRFGIFFKRARCLQACPGRCRHLHPPDAGRKARGHRRGFRRARPQLADGHGSCRARGRKGQSGPARTACRHALCAKVHFVTCIR